MSFRTVAAKEDAPCDCGRGRFVVPNDWWRNELKLVRCNWCHQTAKLSSKGPHVLRKRKDDEEIEL